MSTHRARKRIREAKRKARPELATSVMWTAKDFQHNFDLSYDKVNDTLERIKEDEVSEKEFIERFELPYLPCAIEGVTKNWSAK